MKRKGKWKEKILFFMRDRYGQNDVLNKHILFFGFLSLVIYPFTNHLFWLVLSLILLAYSYFRMLSKNKSARKKENEAYQKWLSPIRFQFVKYKNKETYRYLKCSNCKQKIRVPRNQGEIRVTCPKCSHTKDIKT
ncbi:hypothetical protein P7H60_11990 [Vagococcus carniphilus]|uniref:hypothetical protein n=1 Tax=Vagococcus carniphilus TaxID=218144 RepID=UPI002890940C|nr:hypothetical protein [Vagococcus carniphilus]MDT2814800.1 hypothetical protein [Vagococcus carniphilus]MDT2849865.1 hypothetical protein [Vagococcus carniphilus]MDT2864801.1 hypothetical protein [Vagococcus carniphilus]